MSSIQVELEPTPRHEQQYTKRMRRSNNSQRRQRKQLAKQRAKERRREQQPVCLPEECYSSSDQGMACQGCSECTLGTRNDGVYTPQDWEEMEELTRFFDEWERVYWDDDEFWWDIDDD